MSEDNNRPPLQEDYAQRYGVTGGPPLVEQRIDAIEFKLDEISNKQEAIINAIAALKDQKDGNSSSE